MDKQKVKNYLEGNCMLSEAIGFGQKSEETERDRAVGIVAREYVDYLIDFRLGKADSAEEAKQNFQQEKPSKKIAQIVEDIIFNDKVGVGPLTGIFGDDFDDITFVGGSTRRFSRFVNDVLREAQDDMMVRGDFSVDQRNFVNELFMILQNNTGEL